MRSASRHGRDQGQCDTRESSNGPKSSAGRGAHFGEKSYGGPRVAGGVNGRAGLRLPLPSLTIPGVNSIAVVGLCWRFDRPVTAARGGDDAPRPASDFADH
jgi:hypothetical protein